MPRIGVMSRRVVARRGLESRADFPPFGFRLSKVRSVRCRVNKRVQAMRSSVILPYLVGFILGITVTIAVEYQVGRWTLLPVTHADAALTLVNIVLAAAVIGSHFVRLTP